jgi:hypothetical protein
VPRPVTVGSRHRPSDGVAERLAVAAAAGAVRLSAVTIAFGAAGLVPGLAAFAIVAPLDAPGLWWARGLWCGVPALAAAAWGLLLGRRLVASPDPGPSGASWRGLAIGGLALATTVWLSGLSHRNIETVPRTLPIAYLMTPWERWPLRALLVLLPVLAVAAALCARASRRGVAAAETALGAGVRAVVQPAAAWAGRRLHAVAHWLGPRWAGAVLFATLVSLAALWLAQLKTGRGRQPPVETTAVQVFLIVQFVVLLAMGAVAATVIRGTSRNVDDALGMGLGFGGLAAVVPAATWLVWVACTARLTPLRYFAAFGPAGYLWIFALLATPWLVVGYVYGTAGALAGLLMYLGDRRRGRR